MLIVSCESLDPEMKCFLRGSGHSSANFGSFVEKVQSGNNCAFDHTSVPLLNGLLQLGLLCLFLFLASLGVPEELLGRELEVEQVVVQLFGAHVVSHPFLIDLWPTSSVKM